MLPSVEEAKEGSNQHRHHRRILKHLRKIRREDISAVEWFRLSDLKVAFPNLNLCSQAWVRIHAVKAKACQIFDAEDWKVNC